ncbi:hypothetical protein CFB40_19455 [Burkholderia sp. AU31652]|uniref:Uncharacterized protein n=1 Tax=Burkholderia contaminans TaxID=488447 RepID=A0A6P3A5C2_9BURK|nr:MULTISPECIES: hypothetical protein [Burkholderia]OXI83284.1 hypothetical protein CFB40_19455 [Burkholderia sp. AU31652]OXJ10807.1 hypothetical protein CFB45_28355 [Burkholderia sp. HI2500]VWD41730.1 hypothetical protein BCO71171_04699 [Burkholderia contaminans]
MSSKEKEALLFADDTQYDDPRMRVAVNSDTEMHVSLGRHGCAQLQADGVVAFEPTLPVTDIRANILELASFAVTFEDGKRVTRGTYADGTSFVVSIDLSTGALSASGHEVITIVATGGDRSHAVLTYLPKVNQIRKKTH